MNVRNVLIGSTADVRCTCVLSIRSTRGAQPVFTKEVCKSLAICQLGGVYFQSDLQLCLLFAGQLHSSCYRTAHIGCS